MEIIGILILFVLIFIAFGLANIHTSLEEFIDKNQWNHKRLFDEAVSPSNGLGTILDDIRQKMYPKPWKK